MLCVEEIFLPVGLSSFVRLGTVFTSCVHLMDGCHRLRGTSLGSIFFYFVGGLNNPMFSIRPSASTALDSMPLDMLEKAVR